MMPARSLTFFTFDLVGPVVLLAGLLISLLPPLERPQAPNTPKRILVLYWYNREWPGNVTFEENFRAVLQSAPSGSVEYYSEYLESNRFPGESQSLLLRDYLQQKYSGLTIDVIVAVGDVPLNFLLKYRERLFTNTPIVFLAVKRPTRTEVNSREGITGILQGADYRNTLKVALRLQPRTERVFVISGTVERDGAYEKLCREEFRDFEDKVAIDYLTDFAPDNLVSTVKSLPARSIILYVYQQFLTEESTIIETREILARVASSSAVPIYGLSSWQVGSGVVGGYVRLLEANGARAAQIALQIANGTHAQDIPLESTPVVPMFDWRELSRWEISEDRLPPGSVVRFRVRSFWDEYKWHAIVFASAIAVQLTLILALVVVSARRKRAEEERGRAQAEIAENRSRLAGIIDSAMDAIISADENQRIVLFNDAAEKMFGCAAREVIGEPLERLIPQRFREAHHVHVQTFGETSVTKRSMGSGGPLYGCRADGTEFPIEASISQLDLHGKRFYTVILRDMTDRQRAAEAVRESEQQFRIMADTAPVMIRVLGIDKLCTYFNQQWLDFTGRTMEEELGDGWAELVHPDDHERCLETLSTAFDLRQPFTMEYRLRRADGQFRWVLDSANARFSASGEFLGYIGSCIDITERKTAEQTLEDLSGQLIRAREDECARIARELHDDVNQRMALVSIELEQLRHHPPATPEKLQEQLKEVMSQITETSKEIHRMSYDLHPSKLVHLGLVAALKSLCEELHRRHGLNIEFTHGEIPAELPREISLCLYRIVQECLNNVIRHSGAEESQVTLYATGDEIRLRISDSGRGFDSESPRLKKGLGLVSMRERLRLVGGSISIVSRPSKGSQIDARVPIGRARAKSEGRPPDDKSLAAR